MAVAGARPRLDVEPVASRAVHRHVHDVLDVPQLVAGDVRVDAGLDA